MSYKCSNCGTAPVSEVDGAYATVFCKNCYEPDLPLGSAVNYYRTPHPTRQSLVTAAYIDWLEQNIESLLCDP